MRNPEVTVFMPVYNGQQYIGESIESVLNQTFTDFELLIIDDISTDESVKTVESFNDTRIRLVKNNKHLGLAKIRQKGVDLAKGKYIAFLDYDDIAVPQRLKDQVSFLERNKNICVVGSWIEVIDAEGKKTGQVWRHAGSSELINTILLFRNCITQSSVLLRKDCLTLEYFRSDYWPAPDYDLWVRLSKKCKIANIPSVLTYYRKHTENMSNKVIDEIDRCTRKIMINNLSELKMDVSQKEINIHRMLEPGEKNLSMIQINDIEKWLIKLLNANKKYKLFDAGILNSLVRGYWFKICLGNTQHGEQIYRKFKSSELNQDVRWRMGKELILGLFSLL